MHVNLFRVGAIVLLLLGAQTAVAQPKDPAFTDGLSLGVGVGHENSGLGAHALYYLQLGERWRLAPHIGVGWVGQAGVAGGLMAAFGRRHRLILDVLGGPMAADGGSNISTHLYYGIAALAGWEWMSHVGVALRSSIGPAYRPSLSGSDRFNLAVDILSVDYKLW